MPELFDEGEVEWWDGLECCSGVCSGPLCKKKDYIVILAYPISLMYASSMYILQLTLPFNGPKNAFMSCLSTYVESCSVSSVKSLDKNMHLYSTGVKNMSMYL